MGHNELNSRFFRGLFTPWICCIYWYIRIKHENTIHWCCRANCQTITCLVDFVGCVDLQSMRFTSVSFHSQPNNWKCSVIVRQLETYNVLYFLHCLYWLTIRVNVKKSVLYFTETSCANTYLNSRSIILISVFFDLSQIRFYLYIHSNGAFHVYYVVNKV